MTSSRQEQDIVIRIIKHFQDVNLPSLKIKKIAKAVCSRFGKNEPADSRYETRKKKGTSRLHRENRMVLNLTAERFSVSVLNWSTKSTGS